MWQISGYDSCVLHLPRHIYWYVLLWFCARRKWRISLRIWSYAGRGLTSSHIQSWYAIENSIHSHVPNAQITGCVHSSVCLWVLALPVCLWVLAIPVCLRACRLFIITDTELKYARTRTNTLKMTTAIWLHIFHTSNSKKKSWNNNRCEVIISLLFPFLSD